jgi:nitrite reductase (NADH) large subunit
MKYVIIGNGVAGTTAAEKIRELDTTGEVTIISDEEMPFYSRIRLIEYIAGTIEPEKLVIKKEEWYKDHNIELLLGDPAVDINLESKVVTTKSDKKISFDKLLLATGANAFKPPIPGADKTGVFTLRRFSDAEKIIEFAKGEMKNVVLIGGGVLGLEVANALRSKDKNITVIEALPRLLPRQMDAVGSEVLKKQLESLGFKFHIGRMTKEITGSEKVSGLILDDETIIECDMVVISAGIRSELTLAEHLGLKIDRGVIVDDNLNPGVPDIYCAGDLINHRGRGYGIWPASQQQGIVAGSNMAGENIQYTGTTMSNTLKVIGIDLVSIGNIDADGKFDSIVMKDSEKFLYKKLVFENNIMVGAILYGDKTGWIKIQRAIEEKRDIGEVKDQLKDWDLEVLE